MFLPNSHSFLLVRSKKPVIQSGIFGIAESATSLSRRPVPILHRGKVGIPTSASGSSSSDSGGKVFLPNSHSFLLVRSVIGKPVVQSDIEESETSLVPTQGRDPNIASGPSSPDSGKPTIGDKTKRTFLKVAGIAGAGLVGSLLLPKKAEALIMGSSPTTGVVGVKNATNARINPAREETLSGVLKKTDLALTAGVLDVRVTSTSGDGSSSFSNSTNVATSGRVDDTTRHVYVDVKDSVLPTAASTETTLSKIALGGVQFALRLETVGDIDYLGEAQAGTAIDVVGWRIKKIDSSTLGTISITWADGTELTDKKWSLRTTYTYS